MEDQESELKGLARLVLLWRLWGWICLVSLPASDGVDNPWRSLGCTSLQCLHCLSYGVCMHAKSFVGVCVNLSKDKVIELRLTLIQYGLTLVWLHLPKPCFQIKSHSEVLAEQLDNSNQSSTLFCYYCSFAKWYLTLQPHELQDARLCSPLSSGVSPNSRTLSQWCCLTISSSATFFSIFASIFPSTSVFSNELVLCIRKPKYWSFRFSISPSKE